MKKIMILIGTVSLLVGCCHQTRYKDTGLHYDRLGYKCFLVTNKNSHQFDNHGTKEYVYDVYVRNRKKPVVKSLKLFEQAIVKADRGDIYTKKTNDKNRVTSIKFDLHYNKKRRTVTYTLMKTKKVNMTGTVELAVFDNSRNVVDAKEFKIENKKTQSHSWHVSQSFSYAVGNALVYKK